MNELRDHWDQAYKAKAESSVSWFQPLMSMSLRLIRDAAPNTVASIIDVGGGASTLVDSLLSAGHSDLTVLDISPEALARTQSRLGAQAARINWIASDVTSWSPARSWDVWHDRAAFHFLTVAAAQDLYIAALRKGTHPGSHVIMSTFGQAGPERCSGLLVQRYSPTSLADRIGPPFVLKHHHAECHVTPAGKEQSFNYVVMERLE